MSAVLGPDVRPGQRQSVDDRPRCSVIHPSLTAPRSRGRRSDDRRVNRRTAKAAATAATDNRIQVVVDPPTTAGGNASQRVCHAARSTRVQLFRAIVGTCRSRRVGRRARV